jgi:hypothetical protein
MRIQKSIQEGHLMFDNKMKLDGNPFPQNMVGFSVNMVTTEKKRRSEGFNFSKGEAGWIS